MTETPTARESWARIGRALSSALAWILTAIGGMFASIFAAYQRRYPLERRAAAWDKTIHTFDQVFVGALAAEGGILLGMAKIEETNIDALAIGRAIADLDLQTIGLIILGAFIGALIGAWKAWRRWAVFNGPPLTEVDIQLAVAKGLT